MSVVRAEMDQVHTSNVFQPQDVKNPTFDQKRKALESHMFLEEKK